MNKRKKKYAEEGLTLTFNDSAKDWNVESNLTAPFHHSSNDYYIYKKKKLSQALFVALSFEKDWI